MRFRHRPDMVAVLEAYPTWETPEDEFVAWETGDKTWHVPHLTDWGPADMAEGPEGLSPFEEARLNFTFAREREYMTYSDPASVTVQTLVILVVMAAAVLGNSLMCMAVYRTPHLRTATNLFTICLGATDLAVATLLLPMWMASTVLGATSNLSPFPPQLCQATAFITVVLLLVSISTLAGISLDRYFSICHPLRYPMAVTSRRVFLALGYIWLQSLLLASAPLWGWGQFAFRPQTIPICSPRWGANISYTACVVILGMFLPFSVLLFSYICIIQAARRQAHRIEQIQLQLVQPSLSVCGPDTDDKDSLPYPQPRQRSPSLFQRLQGSPRRRASVSSVKSYSAIRKNLKTLKTVFIVVGAFFVCWGPYVTVNFWSVNHPNWAVPYTLDLLTTLLAFANSAVNPFVFMLLHRDFRFALRFMFLRLLRCLGQDAAEQKARTLAAESMGIQTSRIPSRASFDSGVDIESPKRKDSGSSHNNNSSPFLKPPLPGPLGRRRSNGGQGDNLPSVQEDQFDIFNDEVKARMPIDENNITVKWTMGEENCDIVIDRSPVSDSGRNNSWPQVQIEEYEDTKETKEDTVYVPHPQCPMVIPKIVIPDEDESDIT